MKYLFDTCTVSDFFKGDSHTVQKVKNTSPAEIAISSVTVMELYYGLALNPNKAKTLAPVIDDFLSVITILGFLQEEAKIAANIRASLKKQGRLIGYYDILLAATALQHQLIFVSSNTSEFEPISDLMLQNWRK